MSFSVEGKTTIVTGAANGIGLAIAKHFADVGANVMFADMDDESLISLKNKFALLLIRSLKEQ